MALISNYTAPTHTEREKEVTIKWYVLDSIIASACEDSNMGYIKNISESYKFVWNNHSLYSGKSWGALQCKLIVW